MPTSCPCHGPEDPFDGAYAANKLEELKEFELHEEDAEGWLYRGEGSANIVLAYHGRRPSFVSKFSHFPSSSRLLSHLTRYDGGSHSH